MKRIFDLILSFVLLIVFSPILLCVAFLVLINFGSPVLFRQKRPGQFGKPIFLFKFRSMTNKKDVQDNLLPNEQRHTPFGRKLRATSLDELPSLFNVLIGDMSFVGPRPLKMDYLQLYHGDQMRRHEVRPGITGWAQINGRNKLSFTERFKLDVWYVDHQSIWLDIKILWLTAIKVIRKENIAPENNVEVVPFNGNN